MSSITTINATDLITDSRAVINTNFSNLNSDKIESSYLDTDTTLAANSDTKIPTQKAVKAYVDALGGQTYLVPTGAILPFAGSTVPSNYLLCDGRDVSRSTYATLFGVIGTTYGVGDGSGTFNLPSSATTIHGPVFDSANTKTQTANTTITQSHTIGGDDALLIVGIDVASGSPGYVSVKYNNVNMTVIDDSSNPAIRYYYLAGVAKGTANIVAVWTASAACSLVSVSYLGMSGATLDADNYGTAGPGATTLSLTSTSTNPAFTVVFFNSDNSSTTLPTMTNANVRAYIAGAVGANYNLIIGDLTSSKQQTGADTYNLTSVGGFPSSSIYGFWASFKPFAVQTNKLNIIKT